MGETIFTCVYNFVYERKLHKNHVSRKTSIESFPIYMLVQNKVFENRVGWAHKRGIKFIVIGNVDQFDSGEQCNLLFIFTDFTKEIFLYTASF
jgi:hypothetical protein